MDSRKTITDAVKDAQQVIAEHVQPGPRDCENTINRLTAILDNAAIVEAMEEEDLGQQTDQRPGGQQPYQHS